MPFWRGVSESTYAEKGDLPRPSCTCCSVRDQSEDSGPTTGVAACGDHQGTRGDHQGTRGDHQGTGRASPPGVPRCAVRAAVRPARGWYACPARAAWAVPCAAGTYSTQESGTRSPYVRYGGPRGVRVSSGQPPRAAAGGSTRALRASPSTPPLTEAGRQEKRRILCEIRGGIIRPAAPHRTATAALPHHRTAPQVQGKGRAADLRRRSRGLRERRSRGSIGGRPPSECDPSACAWGCPPRRAR